MAAERGTRLENKLIQLPHDPSSFNEATQVLINMQLEIIDLFSKGTIPKSEALEELIRLSMRMDAFVNEITAEHTMKVAHAQGFDTISNDMSGAQTADWFEKTNRPFSTGFISTGLGVAIIHPDIGMAAVNTNTVTENDLRESFSAGLDDPRIMLEADFGPFASVQSLQKTTEKAITTAFTQFASISPEGIPKEGTMIVLFGVDYAKEKEIAAIQQAAMGSIRKHPMMNDGKFLGNTRGILFNPAGLGYAGELIYGGKNHPKYNEVNIYTRR